MPEVWREVGSTGSPNTMMVITSVQPAAGRIEQFVETSPNTQFVFDLEPRNNTLEVWEETEIDPDTMVVITPEQLDIERSEYAGVMENWEEVPPNNVLETA